MFASLAAKVPRDRDLPARAWTIDVLRRVFEGTIYDSLRHSFQDELRAFLKKYGMEEDETHLWE